jgi:hypothetical protein
MKFKNRYIETTEDSYEKSQHTSVEKNISEEKEMYISKF